jgi:hypothetical protein
MSLYTESGIEIDLTNATAHEKHDAINTIWGGVDFVIEEANQGGVDFIIGEIDRQIWLEMKSWSPRVIPPHRRGGQRRSYLSKMKSKEFPKSLREKFLGTCSFLTLTGNPPNAPILYVLLLESAPTDTALRVHMMTRLRSLIPTRGVTARPWSHTISVVVVDVAEWNSRFPQYPARLL